MQKQNIFLPKGKVNTHPIKGLARRLFIKGWRQSNAIKAKPLFCRSDLFSPTAAGKR